jgi:hypothetical protein
MKSKVEIGETLEGRRRYGLNRYSSGEWQKKEMTWEEIRGGLYLSM